MTKSLTEIITTVQSMLADDGTRFTTAIVTAAVRSALKDYNRAAPVFSGDLVDVVSGQKEYVLNAAAFANLINLIAVLKQGTDEHLEENLELIHHFYFEDNAPAFRLQTAETSGYLIVRFTTPNTVSGLDSASESTLPAYWDDVLVDGACYYSCLFRSTGRVEPINLNQGVVKSLQDTLLFYRSAFSAGLTQAAQMKPAIGVSNPQAAWNDQYHGWNQ